MRIPRIYTDQSLAIGQLLNLAKEPSNHISRVLRLTPDNYLELFNGDGHSYTAQIISIDRNCVAAQVQSSTESDNESPLNLHLFQGISRGDKMDLTLQKAVELGVKTFTPIITERCGVKLDAKRWQKKVEHWQKIIISACEQSARNVIPTLNSVINFQQALNQLTTQSLFLDPNAKKRFRDLQTTNGEQETQLWVGPEGGFGENEVEQIKQAGCQPICLGPRILRTETAALAAVSAINALWGDF